MRNIGLHIRITGSLTDLLQKVERLELRLFQCFLVNQTTGQLIPFDAHDMRKFVQAKNAAGATMLVHGSYWINLASITRFTHRVFLREIEYAKKLDCFTFVVHPGSAKGALDRQQGIVALARALNAILKRDSSITILLENTAHGGMSIGGDLHDYKILLNLLERPEQIAFCIDTAHAYSYGYDIVNEQEREKFIQLIGATVGFDRIALLHINDSYEKLGSKLDKHQVIGQGTIGLEPLKAFMTDERLKHIDVLLELPHIPEDEEIKILELVRSWNKEEV